MISKNFYWWIVSLIGVAAIVVNVIVEQYFIAGLMLGLTIIAVLNYLKYRGRGE